MVVPASLWLTPFLPSTLSSGFTSIGKCFLIPLLPPRMAGAPRSLSFMCHVFFGSPEYPGKSTGIEWLRAELSLDEEKLWGLVFHLWVSGAHVACTWQVFSEGLWSERVAYSLPCSTSAVLDDRPWKCVGTEGQVQRREWGKGSWCAQRQLSDCRFTQR